MVEKEEAGGGISEEEAAQYDRQIRLWGLEAQKRLRASQVLLVGMKGLGAEIAKNLILAGVKGLTMLDHEQVSPEDPGAQFLIRTGSVGRNRAEASLERAQNLNPMVDVKVDTENIEKKPESFFTQFDAKVVFCSVKEALEVDWSSDKAKAALKRTTPDYFLLQEFFLVLKTGVPLLRDFLPSLTIIQRALVLLKFRTDKGRDPSSDTFGEDSELLLQIRNDVLDALGVNPDLLPEDFVRYCFSEMAPVCAVVGGILAQEIVKALSQRDPPHNNFFFFDGMKGNGIVECLGPN
ncbi:SUMO-activating enzyme subunit 1 isoform X3 [Bos indicus]|uniref:SUMO-activating enzyme subunit 1 isoform X3 n=1 Tax=Bos indicus TaxID=9915 RepID=A0A6P5DAB7_BOSIN|nr:SUMO-activating enzyme subunit 1 isoform X2 [Bos taurus]XP_019835181.1 PREDICTED: SUMO-activating enzyme subunit 1 isoform X3 [Bos indicus]XP_027371161.1 SUMO-activating enzyme subunit 1 isoform X3 [Bos indicus x Bos taurus]XP_061244764.1 SUMO-activating enzyme subunit 1 isoform X3 [Bos javanicus]